MSECIAPTAKGWRKKVAAYNDAELLAKLRWAWVTNRDMGTKPPFGRGRHDWTQLRAMTLREARKRGLDLSAAGY